VHDREHARCHVRVGGILRASRHVEAVVIELEGVSFASEFEAAEVVLLMRIVVGVESAEVLYREDGLRF